MELTREPGRTTIVAAEFNYGSRKALVVQSKAVSVIPLKDSKVVARADAIDGVGTAPGSCVSDENGMAAEIAIVDLELHLTEGDSGERGVSRGLSRVECSWEPSTVVVAMLPKTEVSSLVVDANLGLVLEPVCDSREIGRPKGVGNAKLPPVPAAVICQLHEVIGCGVLIVNAKVNARFTMTGNVSAECNGCQTSSGDSPGTQSVNLPLIPAPAIGEAILLDHVVGVKVVHTDLFTVAVGNGSKRGVIDGAEGELFVGPYAVEVSALLDVTIEQLVEGSE